MSVPDCLSELIPLFISLPISLTVFHLPSFPWGFHISLYQPPPATPKVASKYDKIIHPGTSTHHSPYSP